MLNAEIYAKNPLANQIANNGVAEVKDDESKQALKTLRYELDTFVCDGQYEKGLERILEAFLNNAKQGKEQEGVWISGFYGSGKSHLAKMLRALWTDYDFGNGQTARGIAELPQDIKDLLTALTNEAKKSGGLHAASGTLGQGASDRVRTALLGIIFKSAGLSELYHIAQFELWLKSEGIYEEVLAAVEAGGKKWTSERNSLLVSPRLHAAVLDAKPSLAGSPEELRDLFREQFKREEDVTNDQMVAAINDALAVDGAM